MNPQTMASKILNICENNPTIRNKEIIALTGATAPYVSSVRQRYGCTRPGPLEADLRYLSDENQHFISIEAKRLKITPRDLINAIITDARMEDGE